MKALAYLSAAALTAGALAANCTPAFAQDAQSQSMARDLQPIEIEWAHIKYEVHDSDAQEKQLHALDERVAQVVAHYPDRAEPLIWDGVVVSSEAGVAGSFDALGLAKRARDMFERAGKIDYRALDGAVPTSLGALYYMVPGFLLGFGDNDKARQYLQQAIAISPNGLDSNFFYGDFLYRQGEYGEAKKALDRGLTAPAHPDRPVWDAGRRAEIRALLAKVNEKLASND